MSDVTDDIYEVLLAHGAPMHFQELFSALIERGVANRGKSEDTRIYNAIYQDMKKNGENSRFRKAGRAMFVAFEQFKPGEHIPPPPNKTKENPQGVVRSLPRVPQLCGNCKFIEFTGVRAVTLSSGDCARYAESGRLCVQCREGGCPLWERRPANLVQRDNNERKRLKILLDAIGPLAQRGILWGSIDLDKNSKDDKKGKKK